MRDKSGRRIAVIYIATSFGIAAYILDAVIGSLFFHRGGFIDLLILNVPAHELIPRLIVTVLFVLLGALIRSRPGYSGEGLRYDDIGDEKFRKVVESSPMGMHFYRLEPDGSLIFEGANPAADRLLGLDNRQFIGKTIEEAFPGARDTEIAERYKDAAMNGKTWHTEQIYYSDAKIQGAFQVVAFQTSNNRMVALFFDITERKKAEEALKESEEQFRNLSEELPNMIFINRRGLIVYVNNRCEEILGFRKEEFYSPDFDFFSIIAPEYIPLIREKYERHMKGEDVEPYEYALLTKDRRRIQVIINTKIIHYDGENSLLGIVTDISSRKKAEEAIKESEEKFRMVAEKSPNMIFINQQGRIVFVNNKCTEIMGYTKEEFQSPGFDFLTLISPEYYRNIKENFEKHMRGEEVEPFEYVILTKGNKKIDVIISTKLIKYESREAILGIVTDITDRKNAERAMQKSRRDLIMAQNVAKIGSWEWDIRKEQIYWSEELYRIHGMEIGTKLTAELIRSHVYPEDLDIYDKAVRDVYGKISPKTLEYRIIMPGGDIKHLYSASEMQYDDRKMPVRIIGTVQDITERKRAEELREKLIVDLQKAASEIKTLSGLIPICASCKKIRDDKGYWAQIETYIMEHSDAEFSHGLCPECSKRLYPDLQ